MPTFSQAARSPRGRDRQKVGVRKRGPNDRTFWRLLSPEFILTAVWIAGPLSYLAIKAFESRLVYFQILVAQEGINDDFSVMGFTFLLLSFGLFMIGSLLASTRPPSRGGQEIDYRLAFKVLLATFAVVCVVATLWMGVAIAQVGVNEMIRLAESDNIFARDIVLSASFPGGRLVSNGFVATAIFSAYILAKFSDRIRSGDRATLVSVIIVSLLYLGLAPILVSGRIHFFAAVIGSYIAVCITRRHFVGAAYLPLAILLLATVWGAKQYFSLSHISQESVFTQAWQGFLFYVYNDFVNSVSIVGHIDGNYTLGWYSTRFVLFFTFTDKLLLTNLQDRFQYLDDYLGGGEFPLLTAPYVDFGWMGLLMLPILGYIIKLFYDRARRDDRFGTVYGLIVAGLAVSMHSMYITLQDSVFNIILLLVMLQVSSGRTNFARMRRSAKHNTVRRASSFRSRAKDRV